MFCKCNWNEGILAVIIIVFSFVQAASAKWVVVIAAVLLLLHALACNKSGMCGDMNAGAKKKNYYSKKGKRG